jgi:cytochrome c oxidase assembly factor CtaG
MTPGIAPGTSVVHPPSPWAYVAHPFLWAAVALVLGGCAVVAWRSPHGARRALWLVVLAVLLVLAVESWPLGDLATHGLLSALVVQRLVLLLAVPPLLVAGVGAAALRRLTRPAPVDAVVRTCARPAVAVGVVTIGATATLATPVVTWAAASGWGRAVIAVVVVALGFVLWLPVLGGFPGLHRPEPLGRAAYLVVQSIVPSFLAVVWIFARRPLYPPFDHPWPTLGLSSLGDQQLAGFIAKLGTIAVLWTVAFVTIHRSQAASGAPSAADGEPLLWSDVERELERAERRSRRSGAAWLPSAQGLRSRAERPQDAPDDP